MAGPIVAVHREHLLADVSALTAKIFTRREFPYPDFAQLLSCFTLDTIPVGWPYLLWGGNETQVLRHNSERLVLRGAGVGTKMAHNRLVRLKYQDPLLQAVELLTVINRDN
jgi:hypothetical protein